MDRLATPRLFLVLQSMEDVREMMASLAPEQRTQISPHWFAMVAAADEPSPWVHGFKLVRQGTDLIVGTAGYKGPPGASGMVEIAYQVAPEHQGQGFATEAAAALTDYAFSQPAVTRVWAHTVLNANASARVLTKCGFKKLGEVMDPEDGPVWRWEKVRV